ncbi:hypothetical protein OCH80_06685 [Lactobacillus sp. 23-2]|uniref:YobI family P-loop NTPase n=1 Tax=Lactobacillus sp. 23-2 TaxID=2981842 RepID=UPI0038376A54
MGLYSKLIYCKRKSNSKESLHDLAPNDNLEADNKYLNLLDEVLKSADRLHNVALTGPYGSGKSSIIASYLKKHPDVEKISLNISLATFSLKKGSGDGGTSSSEEEIQKGILKQIFYKVKPSKIPLSRYRKLHTPSTWKIFCVLIVLAMTFGIGSYVFNYKLWSKNRFLFDQTLKRVRTSGIPYFIIWIVIICIALSLITILIKAIAYILSRLSLSKINVGTVAEVDKKSSESVFDKNMDELSYFFETTNYRIVFFEDLDRWGNIEIFSHLRELNSLLNRDDAIKEPIVFVYAIGDDVFQNEEERTKFFDYIIPVIPIMNATNAGEILLGKVKHSKLETKITQDFIFDVSPYIPNIRVLVNIWNEFEVYEPIIIEKQGLSLNEEKLLALIIFKNLYPQDFAELELEQGIVKDVFNRKESYLQTIKEDLQKQISNLENKIGSTKNEVLKSYKELMTAFLLEVTDYRGIAINFYNRRYSLVVHAEDILSEKQDLRNLKEKEITKIEYISFSDNRNYETNCNIDKLYDKYESRVEFAAGAKESKVKDLQSQLQKLKQRLLKLDLMTLAELIENYQLDNYLSAEVKEKDLLVFLLRRGYIDEQYASYINYFKGNSISREDQNFILSVKNRKRLPQSYKLTKVANVADRLRVAEFGQKEIYNNDLIDYLLLDCYDQNKKLTTFIEQLTDETEDSWSFISNYLSRRSKERKIAERRFVEKLAHAWPNMFNYIENRLDLSPEMVDYYLELIFNFAAVPDIDAMDVSEVISKHLSYTENSLQRFKEVKVPRMTEILDNALSVKFSKEDLSDVPKSMVNHISAKRYYEINEKMLYEILGRLEPDLQQGFNKHAYTNLLKLDHDEEPQIQILRYIREEDNLLIFMDRVVLADDNISESIDAISDLLGRLKENEDYQNRLLQHEEYVGDKLSEFTSDKPDQHIWNLVLNNNKVKATWITVNEYWSSFKFSRELLQFIQRNTDSIIASDQSVYTQDQDSVYPQDFVNDLFTNATWDDNTFSNLATCFKGWRFSGSISDVPEQNLKVLIDQDFFEFTQEYYDQVKSVSDELATTYILKHQLEALDKLDNSEINELAANLLASPFVSSELINEIVKNNLPEQVIDQDVAINLTNKNFDIDESYFFAIWKYLSNDKRISWMLDNVALLDRNGFYRCFSELTGVYQNFFEKYDSSKEVKLENNKENETLAKRLCSVGYATSFRVKNDGKLAVKLKKLS